MLYDLASPQLCILPREMETHISVKTCIWMFVVALFIADKKHYLLFIVWWIITSVDKQTVIDPYNRILLCYKKESIAVQECQMNYTKWRKSDSNQYTGRVYFYELLQEVDPKERSEFLGF